MVTVKSPNQAIRSVYALFLRCNRFTRGCSWVGVGRRVWIWTWIRRRAWGGARARSWLWWSRSWRNNAPLSVRRPHIAARTLTPLVRLVVVVNVLLIRNGVVYAHTVVVSWHVLDQVFRVVLAGTNWQTIIISIYICHAENCWWCCMLSTLTGFCLGIPAGIIARTGIVEFLHSSIFITFRLLHTFCKGLYTIKPPN